MVARIIAVADTFDAITTDRPYRKKRTEEEAVEEIRRCAGSQFDRMVTEAFLKAHESGEIRRILKDNAA
jgi:HD-GYP domain-containing protein (c-di-GMP phosphodiesterase class II)